MKRGERLKELQEKQILSESQVQNCETRMLELSAELTKSKDLKRDQDQLRRNIVDNLEYRNVKAQADELTLEIESLEDRILKMGGVSMIETELVRLSKERERLLTEV